MGATSENNGVDRALLNRDRAMVNAILRGSAKAWHNFLTDYSTLIYNVVRRHMFAEDEDEVRTAYVDILKLLHDGAICGYECRSRLSTWLIVYTRARTFDHLRSRNGRYREPAGVRKLDALSRRVLQLYYIEKLSLEIVVHTLKWEGYDTDAGGVVDAIQRIESCLDRRYLRRLENEARLASTGASSVRMLKYLVRLQHEYGSAASDETPEKNLLEQENRRMAQRVREAVENLDPVDREIVRLRFEHNLSAAKIADKVGFARPRQVYTALEKILARLRISFCVDKTGDERPG